MISCVCGYKKGDSWAKEEKDIGDEEFIILEGIAPLQEEDLGRIIKLKLIACPKCGTVKVRGI